MMQVASKFELENLKVEKGIGLGNFDGLHIGHMTLIDRLINESMNLKVKSMIYTFINHPQNIINKKFMTPQIMTKSGKIDFLTDTGLDYIYFQEFNDSFLRMEPIDFLKKILIDKLNAKIIVVGFDYRFGYKGKGSIDFLRKYENIYDYKLIVIPPVRINDTIVSSTLIRNKIKSGDLKSVKQLMGRYYSISGDVITGRRIGRKLGFPTANITLKKSCVIPKYGVYSTNVRLNGIEYKGLTNVGINPTFKDRDFSIETYIIDFEGDIYGKKLDVEFVLRLRDEIKFNNKEDLIEQIKKDINMVRNI
jgi:riboflavin kinase/FMN adenylyltransferase